LNTEIGKPKAQAICPVKGESSQSSPLQIARQPGNGHAEEALQDWEVWSQNCILLTPPG
jgi:hypothetical protein